MAQRRLLGDEQWAALFALPTGERDVVRHCKLTPDNHTLVAAKRSAPNRLGYALRPAPCVIRAGSWSPGRAHPSPWVPRAAATALTDRSADSHTIRI